MTFTTAAQHGWAAGPQPDLNSDSVQSLFRSVVISATRVAWASGTSDYEDVVQQVCVDLLNDLRRGKWPQNPAGWAATVARRRIWRDARNSERELPTTTQALNKLAVASDDQVAEVTAERDLVLTWLKTLPSPLQTTIALRIDGYSVAETALRLGIPQRVVERRLVQGLRLLRGALLNQMALESRDFHTGQPNGASEWRGTSTSSQQAMLSAEDQAAHMALADLPPRQKQVLQLSRRGYKPAQIARLLGLSANTVRVNLHHARKRLERILDRMAEQTRQPERGREAGRA